MLSGLGKTTMMVFNKLKIPTTFRDCSYKPGMELDRQVRPSAKTNRMGSSMFFVQTVKVQYCGYLIELFWSSLFHTLDMVLAPK